MKSFVHLHLHSQYSLLDGTIQFGPLVERVRGLGMPAVAVTDHGGMMGTIEFYEEARKAGVKPIVGTEIYVAPGSREERKAAPTGEYAYHLILLAENAAGYRNLLKLSSLAHTEGFYYRPRVDKELLRRHSEGLIATSACLQGEIPFTMGAEGEARALDVLDEYRSIFPDGRFFLEIQDNGLPEQDRMNPRIIALARRTGTPLVATNDCHYLNREDARFQEILLCLQTGKTMSDPTRMRFGTEQFYVKSAEEFERAFGHAAPDALSNTLRIAERCNVEIELGKNMIPEFDLPPGETSEGRLRKDAEEGFEERLEELRVRDGDMPPDLRKEYRRRLDYELSVIEKTGFSGYFLIVADFINYAKRRGIPVGPGRGSAAGSLVAFCLRITEVDPIPYKLLFERFLNPERISLPDIDCDFCKDRRDEVIAYVQEKYGRENVAQLITFGTWKPRAAVRDVGRVLEMPYAEVDRIAKLIPADLKMTLENAPKAEPKLQEMIDSDPKIAELFRYSREIEGRSRHAGTHASAVVIANRPITEYCPLYRQTTGEITTQYSMKPVERVGLVKFDFLGLRNLTSIHDTLRLLKERKGIGIDLNTLPLTDGETYKTLSRGDTAGVFQSESHGFTELIKRLKPDRFNHLIDMMALYRPGPLQSGMADDFVERRHGRKKVAYPLPQLEEILSDTYGVILYQEQVMEIAKSLAGFTLGQADVLRKAMGKKDDALMEKQKGQFLEGARANGIPEKKAAEIFDLIRQFGGYGFNKSHSTAYALVAYQTAYLKTHHTVEYLSALMTSESGDTDKIIRYIAYSREKGIPILPPDVNESQYAFFPSGDGIRFGLSAIKGLGASAVEAILDARKDRPFDSARDFLFRTDLRKVNKRAVESLIKSGALDSLDPDRGKLFNDLPSLLDEAQAEARRRESGQFALFGAPSGESPVPRPVKGRENAAGGKETWSRRERLQYEKEALGFYITGHPLESFAAEIAMYANFTTAGLAKLKDETEVKIGGIVTGLKEKVTRKGDRMAGLTLEDQEGTVDVTVFPKTWQECRDALSSPDPVFLVGRLKHSENGFEIHADEAFLMANVRERLAKSVHFRLHLDRAGKDDVADLAKSIRRHSGEKRAFLHLIREGEYEAVLALPSSEGVSPSLDLARELKARFGYGVLRID
ncbi:MAG: DNA polymerase III subunit alpha [Thermodesulfobacteriota bacterium]